MKNRLIKTILILFCVILDSVCCGCAASVPEKLENASIEHETELGGAYLHITIHDFWILDFSSATAFWLSFQTDISWRIFLSTTAITCRLMSLC